MEKRIDEAHRSIWSSVAFLLLIMYGVTFLLLRRVVSGPVSRLEEMVNRIALGDLSARCQVESNDELGRLAQRFNSMADKLGESGKELRESESRYQLVLEGSQLGYWDWDIETNRVIRNARWAEMLGFSLEEINPDISGIEEVLHPEDKEFFWKSLNDHLAGMTPVHDIEFRLRCKDDAYIWINDQARVVSRDSHGQALRMCGTHRDVSMRKRAEWEKAKLQAQLAQTQKMESIGQLAGGVAHDFNNMLGVILGYTELAMAKTEANSFLYQYLKEVLNAGNRSAEITKQLLAFARKQTVQPKIIELNKSVENMLKMLRRLIGDHITLAWKPGEGVGHILIDPSQLDQILANLCVNARDAITGVGNVTVETGRKSFSQDFCNDNPGFLPGNFAFLIVSDNGCGMEKELIDKIFEPFFTTKSVGEGTGLGLSTVYGIVKQNGGFLNVYSEKDQGTAFKIYLPQQTKSPNNHDRKVLDIQQTQRCETILIVEDEPKVLRMLRTMLERLGYHVLAAQSAVEAIRLFEEHQDEIHLTITDVIMKDMNGRDLADELGRITDEKKILFMSGYTSDVIAKQGILDEGINFIQKPFSIDDLASIVRDVLDRDL